jgi:hypothetical protein
MTNEADAQDRVPPPPADMPDNLGIAEVRPGKPVINGVLPSIDALQMLIILGAARMTSGAWTM